MCALSCVCLFLVLSYDYLLHMVVIQNTADNQRVLMGSNWLEAIRLDWTRLTREGHESALNAVNSKTVLIFSRPDIKN